MNIKLVRWLIFLFEKYNKKQRKKRSGFVCRCMHQHALDLDAGLRGSVCDESGSLYIDWFHT
jgi:hypothetical protein